MKLLRKAVKNCMPYGIVNKYFNHPQNIISSDYQDVYNQYGEKMTFAYLKDEIAYFHPYTFVSGRFPRHLIWDRNNHSLNLQMYTHRSILDRVPLKDGMKQFGILYESEAILPEDYNILYHKEDEIKSLNALFTFSERMLDKYENARFSLAYGVWYGTAWHGGFLDANRYQKKSKLVSIVASNKKMTPIHMFRADVARELKRKKLADAMGTAVGSYFEKNSDAFDDYMYNVAIENYSAKYYFTEKILDCFASMTVPIYYGAQKITDFFNEDGIIFIKEPTLESVLDAIGDCSERDYNSRINAIKDNYERVQHFLTIEDYITEKYKALIFG